MEETGRSMRNYISWSSKCINENPARVIWLNMDLCFPSTRGWVLAMWWKHIIRTTQRGGQRVGKYSALNLWSSHSPVEKYIFQTIFSKSSKEERARLAEYECVRDCCQVSRAWNTHRPFLLDELSERQSLKLQVTRPQIHGRQRGGYEHNKSYQIHVRPRRSLKSIVPPRPVKETRVD